MPKILLHHIDVINNEYVTGWCFNRLLPRAPLTIRLYLNNQLIGKTRCQRNRPDVCEAGLHPTGNCGFLFRFDQDILQESDQTIYLQMSAAGKTIVSIPTSKITPTLKLSRPFCFMHIPKTAGTSFNNHLQGWFGYEQWHNHIEVLSLEEQRTLSKPGHYVAGHLPLYKFREIIDLDDLTPLHTIIRNPVHQLHSHLAWIKGIGNDQHSAFFHQHPSVVQQLARQLQQHDLSTASGISKFIGQINGFQLDFFDNLQTRYFLNHRPEQVSEQDFKHAISNTTLFSSIGTTENYQDYLQQCATRYRRPAQVRQLTQHNPSRVSPLFDFDDPEILSALIPLIQFDLRLYEHVVDG